MTQKIINVGTVANDGTGDTIRGAFTNVNANFTEVYGDISSLTSVIAGIDAGQNTTIGASYTTANSAYQSSNVVFGRSNLISDVVNSVFTVANAAYNNANVGLAAANTWANTVGTAGNTYTSDLVIAGNNYASVLAANNAVGANAWTNTVTASTYAWANTKFDTVANTTLIVNTTNAAFTKANSALQNTSGTLGGNITITGTVTSTVGFYDGLGPVRERFLVVADANTPILVSHSVVIANSPNNIHIEIPNDNVFLSPANIGSSIYIYQYGSGNTKIVAQTASVTVRSSNNWANIAGQYLSATAVKVLPNTWILTGDLKA
jgi:hypothetical protein